MTLLKKVLLGVLIVTIPGGIVLAAFRAFNKENKDAVPSKTDNQSGDESQPTGPT